MDYKELAATLAREENQRAQIRAAIQELATAVQILEEVKQNGGGTQHTKKLAALVKSICRRIA